MFIHYSVDKWKWKIKRNTVQKNIPRAMCTFAVALKKNHWETEINTFCQKLRNLGFHVFHVFYCLRMYHFCPKNHFRTTRKWSNNLSNPFIQNWKWTCPPIKMIYFISVVFAVHIVGCVSKIEHMWCNLILGQYDVITHQPAREMVTFMSCVIRHVAM